MKGLLIGLGVLVIVAVGFLFLRLPQPIIEIAPEAVFTIGGFSITNTMFTGWVMVAVISLVTILGTRKLSLIPSGFQNAFEAIVEGFANIVEGVAGDKNGRRFFPVVFAFLLYIVLCNWAALLPFFNVIGKTDDIFHHVEHEAHEHPGEEWADGEIVGWIMTKSGSISIVPMFKDVKHIKIEVPEGFTNLQAFDLMNSTLAEELDRPAPAPGDFEAHVLHDDETYGFIAPWFRGVNTDINSPLAYAIWSAIFVEFWGITALGLLTYGSKFFDFKALFKGDIIKFFVGLLEFVSELSRLMSFTFRLFGNIFAGEVLLFMMTFLVPLVLVDLFYGLELFVGLIQGFVFAMLTLVFAVGAVSHHGDHDEHGHADAHGGDQHGATGHHTAHA